MGKKNEKTVGEKIGKILLAYEERDGSGKGQNADQNDPYVKGLEYKLSDKKNYGNGNECNGKNLSESLLKYLKRKGV